MTTHDGRGEHPGADDARTWEQRYGESARVWSGAPNATLVRMLTEPARRGLEPGNALDVGCG